MQKFLLIIFFILSLLCKPGFNQDSVDIEYSIVGMEFHTDYDVLKLRVSPWLSTEELMNQIKRAVLWPGAPLPKKETYIYVFKETEKIMENSPIRAIYHPERGFDWELHKWKPAIIPNNTPSQHEIVIYNHLIDCIIEEGSTLDNLNIRKKVAKDFNMTVGELDSIYCWVKFWMDKLPIPTTQEKFIRSK